METAKLLQELWRALLPNCEAPPFEQFVRWLGSYDEQIINRGIRRASSKLYKTTREGQIMTPADCFAYATSVMRHEALGQRSFNGSTVA